MANDPALASAIAAGDAQAVARLLAKTPALALGWKPIMDAAFAGHAPVVAVLLDAGADPNVVSPNSHRHRPLVRASEWKSTIPRTAGHRAVVELLLQRGADPALPGGMHRWTPLAHAAMSDEAGLVAVLREGRRLNLQHAAMLLEERQVKKLLARDGSDADERDQVNRNALHYLAASGLFRRLGSQPALRIASDLCAAGADVHAAQTNISEIGFDATPLWWSVSFQEHPALAEYLLSQGASPQPGWFAATFNGNVGILDLLLAHGAVIDARVDGRTALHDLLRYRRPRCVPWLLDHGADANAATASGDRPLHFAVTSGARPETVAALLDAGADPALRNAAGATAASLAGLKGNAKVLDLLRAPRARRKR